MSPIKNYGNSVKGGLYLVPIAKGNEKPFAFTGIPFWDKSKTGSN